MPRCRTFEEMVAATKRLPTPPPSSPDDSDNPEGLSEAEIEHLADSLDVTDLAQDKLTPTSSLKPSADVSAISP